MRLSPLFLPHLALYHKSDGLDAVDRWTPHGAQVNLEQDDLVQFPGPVGTESRHNLTILIIYLAPQNDRAQGF